MMKNAEAANARLRESFPGGFALDETHQPHISCLHRYVKTAEAFVTTKEDPEINQPTIDYVASFVPNETGKKFNPHVSIGIASQDYLKKMLDETFEAFTFSPAGAAVYQLGPSARLRRNSRNGI